MILGEIEERQQAGKSTPFCLRFPAFRELIHEVQDVINRQIPKFVLAELRAESVQNKRM